MVYSELGEKITFLVNEFSKNPQLFIASYRASVSFDSELNYNMDSDLNYNIHSLVARIEKSEVPEPFFEVTPIDKIGYYFICGDWCNRHSNQRWIFKNVRDDIITFAPQTRDHTINRNKLIYSEAFVAPEVLDYLDYDYSEEELFQYSTLYKNEVLDNLELFLYLKEHCTIPFMMNIMKFDIDFAIRLYGWENV